MTRGLINDYYSLPFALLATFKTLKTFAPLHCFVTFFFIHNVRNIFANSSSPSITILLNTLLIIKRKLFYLSH